MAGDDVERDIVPAHRLGLKTWWITDDGDTPEPCLPPCDRHGSLADFLIWLET